MKKRWRAKPIFLISVISLFLFGADYYLYTALESAMPEMRRQAVAFFYWTLSLFFILLIYQLVKRATRSDRRNSFITGIMVSAALGIIFGKVIFFITVLADDLLRGSQWLADFLQNMLNGESKNIAMAERNKKIIRSGMALATLPVTALTYGITIGAHDYKVSRVKLPVKDLQPALEGFKIGQISDIHAGSLRSRKGVSKGIYRLLNEKPDLVFFTGDLVNTSAHEVEDMADIFSMVDAPRGVYSILGNHDYGLYRQWNSEEEKERNFSDLIDWHEKFGWKLLRNEHDVLDIEGSKLGIIGIENWGKSSRMPKFGDLGKAMEGMPPCDVNVLLSHDPSFWEAKLLKEGPENIHLTLSGHTHGMQFGVHTRYFKWSPVRYVSKHWSGLYTKGDQHLYVNRGFGHHGFPGRIGMPPEITIIELIREA